MRVADVDAARWSANAHVTGAGDEYTALARGLYARKLKLPVTADGCMCLERHRLYAAGKYREVDLPAMTDGLTRMRRGVVFMGVGSHWHFLMDGLGQLQPRAMGDGRETLYLDADISADQERSTLAFARAAGFAPFASVERIAGDWLAVDDCAFPCRRLITHQVACASERLRIAMLCSFEPVKYAIAKGYWSFVTTRRSAWIPFLRRTLDLVGPCAITLSTDG